MHYLTLPGTCPDPPVFDLITITALGGEPGASVSIVSGYWLDDRAIEFRSPTGANGFLL
jgi:hypothetical protein